MTIEERAVNISRRIMTVRTFVEPFLLTLKMDDEIPVFYSPSASFIDFGSDIRTISFEFVQSE